MVRPSTGLALLLSVALASSGTFAAEPEKSTEQATPAASPQQSLTSGSSTEELGMLLPAVQTIRETARR